MEKFTLINKARSRIKVFEPFEDSSKNSSMNNAILISCGCVFKRSSKPVMKGSRVESIQEAKKNIKTFGGRVGKNLQIQYFFKKNGIWVLYLKFEIMKN